MKKVFLLFFLFPVFLPAQDGWRSLFNGQNFDGWDKLNGKAEYRIEGGEIVGVSAKNTPNTFLATKEKFTDFILEVEVKVAPELNSGIQFRSNSLDEYKNGRVHGYQAEIDPSPRAYSGGIYDEARRGWLYPLTENEDGKEAFKVADWNTFHIEAVGNEIRIWVNGINTANIVDNMTAEGFIALQIHSIKTDEQIGKEVRWKNIKIKTTDLGKERWKISPQVPEYNYIPNYLTEKEKREGWRMLWDGKTTEGWRSARSESFPEKGWKMNNGILTVLETGGREAEAGGDIITCEKFSSFELKLDFKITKGANSGIKYFVDPAINKGPGSSIGLEYQILDDEVHPDAKKGVNGNRTLCSLYDLITAENLSEPGRPKRKVFRGVGEWNTARIVVRGNHIEHWLNNYKFLEYERSTQMYRSLVAYSKYKIWENFGELPEGHILLQDHGNEVHFRNIKIREF